ncbi:hypothetical protein NM208_g3809 [Fusarium decemcellulare]|uniref:Uncharacterized protein n=1 Tax=Fusarium decemcellulare TaxID=57161 RepID=A0ACC1SMX5_9HYPO|nr:hypothetical protein NM208_g3809 [Fusarium decemcellulare]
MSAHIKVAIAGATGRNGPSIVSALLNSTEPKFEVTTLMRPDSLQKASTVQLAKSGVKIASALLQNPQQELVSILTGIDVVICILPPDSTADQIPLANAALKAGVKRFVPNMWATSSPPRGVMTIRDWKEDVLEHVKRIYLPYTIIDIGFWHEIMIPRIPSGKLDHVAAYSDYFLVDNGLAPCATSHIDDVGRFVARIISDPRTINRMVFAYGEVATQDSIVQLVESLSGEKVPLTKVTSVQVEKTVRSRELDLWPQVILEYAYSAWARGDNDPQKADYLGYLDAKELYPDIQVKNIEDTIQQALTDGGVNPGFGNEEKCASIASALAKWKIRRRISGHPHKQARDHNRDSRYRIGNVTLLNFVKKKSKLENPSFIQKVHMLCELTMSSSISIHPSACVASAIPTPSLFGAEILSINTTLVTDYSYDITQGRYASHHAFNVSDLSFCNVSLYYTHPGYDDHVNVQVWLPLDTWNGRFQGTGGGGLVVGLSEPAMAGAVAEGYAVASSNGGHTTEHTQDWVLKSPGNINWPLVLNYGSTAMYDFTVIGKNITESFYGVAPEYSYFTGCSNGGRQGLAIAQKWPDLYDGILAGAPGIYFPQLVASLSWPQLLMHWKGQVPEPCELVALTEKAIEACDYLDGAVDGIITDPTTCHFDPYTLVNSTILCAESGKDIQISEIAAYVASNLWDGARASNGEFLWYGITHDAPFSGSANTTCDYQESGDCSAVPYSVAVDFIELFIYKDPTFSFTDLSREDYARVFQRARQDFDNALGATDSDLRSFGSSGGKLLMWHGVADQIVPHEGSRKYYDGAKSFDSNVSNYLRYFEAPGVHHCREGPGAYPGDILDSLVTWVEKGKAPSEIPAISLPNNKGVSLERNLCQYPLQQTYKGYGDVTKPGSFYCE